MFLKNRCRVNVFETAEHFVATVVMRKEPHHTWLKSVSLNLPNVTGKFWWHRKKTNCRTRDWKICAVGIKATANIWLENFGAIGKKRFAEHVTGKFLCRRKKATAEHMAGKF